MINNSKIVLNTVLKLNIVNRSNTFRNHIIVALNIYSILFSFNQHQSAAEINCPHKEISGTEIPFIT